MTPFRNRRSSRSPSCARTLSGRARLPPPTTIGHKNRWHSSTSPAPIAWPASSAPPTVMPAPRGLLEPPDGVSIDLALDPRPRAGYRLKRPGVHDLLSCPPDPSKVPDHCRLIGLGAHGLPEHHRLVHPAPV